MPFGRSNNRFSLEDERAMIALQRIIHEETHHIKALISLGHVEIDEATVEEKRFH